MSNQKDKYQEDIEYLNNNPDEIEDAWGGANDHPHGSLFSFICEDRLGGEGCGCPTMIKSGSFYAEFKGKEDLEMTVFIRAMDIPSDPQFITSKHLPLFREIQLKADRKYNRS